MEPPISHDPESRAQLSDVGKDAADMTMLLHAERAAITRNPVVTSTVRVVRQTMQREEVLQQDLAVELVEITRVPIGRVIDAIPATRQDGDTTIISVVEEILVTEKRLVLKEEIHLQRIRTTRTHTETIALREQHAVISRTAASDDVVAPIALDTPEHPIIIKDV